MSGTTGTTTADRQRLRASRRSTGTPANRLPSPPRQRRPALAAIGVLMVVGGALVAGLLAIRMDSRVEVIAVRSTIEPGTKITAADLTSTPVASDEVSLVGWRFRDEIVGRYYATGTIYAGMLLDQHMISTKNPVGDGRAIVSVQLTPALAPKDLQPGDLVQVVRASNGSANNADAQEITQALVRSVTRPEKSSLGGSNSGSVDLLVPQDSAKDVIDASRATLAGLALLSRGNSVDVIPGS